MGHKIFISYKYHDQNVKGITKHNSYHNPDTVRDYVDLLEIYIGKYSDNIYKGESDNEDLSSLSKDTIREKLKNRIYDSTLTIVIISPNMNTGVPENLQWIPWEVSYSLKEVSRKNEAGKLVTSTSNAMIALVLPDRNGSYDYYMKEINDYNGKRFLLDTNFLFPILRKNMFNQINAQYRDVNYGFQNKRIYSGESSYILSVRWNEFINNPEYYIERAYKIQNSIKQYNIFKELEQ